MAYHVRLDTPEMLQIIKENEEEIRPLNEDAIKELACAVIFGVLKTWRRGGSNYVAKDFFLSEDYVFWSAMAGFDVDGQTILNQLQTTGHFKARSMKEV